MNFQICGLDPLTRTRWCFAELFNRCIPGSLALQGSFRISIVAFDDLCLGLNGLPLKNQPLIGLALQLQRLEYRAHLLTLQDDWSQGVRDELLPNLCLALEARNLNSGGPHLL
ncbi:hypothetical protein [Deinococcus altitudinis]|uniref:hypothetical protein n=1 Tax=Deinococcus altitudinis TaxID=468914 RepID=UPI00389185D1